MIHDQFLYRQMKPEYLTSISSNAMKYPKENAKRISPIPKRKVHFSDTSMMIMTKPRSEADLKASWYSKNEIKHFRNKTENSARKFAKSRDSKVVEYLAYSVMSGTPQSDINFHHNDIVCGIEHMISGKVLKILIQRRRMTIARVLEEQDVQHRLGEKDFTVIALASMANSAFTKEWRRRIACLHICNQSAIRA